LVTSVTLEGEAASISSNGTEDLITILNGTIVAYNGTETPGDGQFILL
jgi:hypothetical protein